MTEKTNNTFSSDPSAHESKVGNIFIEGRHSSEIDVPAFMSLQ